MTKIIKIDVIKVNMEINLCTFIEIVNFLKLLMAQPYLLLVQLESSHSE